MSVKSLDAAALVLAVMAAPSLAAEPIPVTVDNFVRAESDLYFNNVVRQVGIGAFHHSRETMPIDRQTVIRGNRDTLYSSAVFDLDAGPVTITLPDAGSRFMSLQTISKDHYTTTLYEAGEHTIDKEQTGTRYAMVGIRTLVNPDDPQDVQKAHALQDAIKVTQPGGTGHFEVPAWDQASQKKVRDALLVLASTVTDTSRAFGTKSEVDPVQRLLGPHRLGARTHPRTPSISTSCPTRTMGRSLIASR